MARSAPRTPVLLFGFLALYILLQSAWWMWLLLSKDRDIFALQQQLVSAGILPHFPVRLPKHTLIMVLGEGSVFLLLLLLALWITFRTLKHELSLARQQRDFLMAASHELRTPIAGLKLTCRRSSGRTSTRSGARPFRAVPAMMWNACICWRKGSCWPAAWKNRRQCPGGRSSTWPWRPVPSWKPCEAVPDVTM